MSVTSQPRVRKALAPMVVRVLGSSTVAVARADGHRKARGAWHLLTDGRTTIKVRRLGRCWCQVGVRYARLSPCPPFTRVHRSLLLMLLWVLLSWPHRCGGFLQNKGFQKRRRRLHRLPRRVRVQHTPFGPVPEASRTRARMKGAPAGVRNRSRVCVETARSAPLFCC